MLDRHCLRYFLAVVDAGTFSRAAELCRVSQPTVSSGIARLEGIVGQPLFNRSNRRVELTPAGTRLLVFARRIENEFLEAQRSLHGLEPAKLLRLGVASTIPTKMVESVIGACIGVKVEIVERRPSELRPLFDRGRVDMILGPGESGVARNTVELFREPYQVALTAHHPLAKLDVLSSEQIAQEAMLVRRQCEALPMISQFFTSRGIRPFIAARSLNDDRVACYVRAGLGITVMPISLIEPGIVARPLAGLDLSRTVGLSLEPGMHGRFADTDVVERISEAVRGFAP